LASLHSGKNKQNGRRKSFPQLLDEFQ